MGHGLCWALMFPQHNIVGLGERLLLTIRQHEFAPEGLGQDGLVEFWYEPRGVGVLGGDAVEPGEGCFNAADDFLLFNWAPRKIALPCGMQISFKNLNTFGAIAREFLDKKRREAKAEGTLAQLEWRLSLARPAIGARAIAEITAPEILGVLRSVETRGRHETARRLRATIGEVFRYAVATGRADADPTAALKGALTAPTVQHRAAIIEPKAFGALLRAIETYEGAPETRAALELAALTFVRPGELRAAEWAEIDLDAGVWSIPGEKMKMKRPHRIPLAPRAIAILRELQTITGRGKFLFPSIRSAARCMSENTINAALRRLGFKKDEMTGHGFRSAASSLLNESGIWNADAIERQLAHVDNDNVRRAYARADFWDERVRMMTWWADRCDELRCGSNVVVLRG